MAEKLKRKSNLKFKYFVNYVLVGTALVLCIILGQAGMLSRSRCCPVSHTALFWRFP